MDDLKNCLGEDWIISIILPIIVPYKGDKDIVKNKTQIPFTLLSKEREVSDVL